MKMKKKELLQECKEIMMSPKVEKWYKENLETKPQYETINSLEKAVGNNELTIREALSLCLIVGSQWNVKFEGVP